METPGNNRMVTARPVTIALLTARTEVPLPRALPGVALHQFNSSRNVAAIVL